MQSINTHSHSDRERERVCMFVCATEQAETISKANTQHQQQQQYVYLIYIWALSEFVSFWIQIHLRWWLDSPNLCIMRLLKLYLYACVSVENWVLFCCCLDICSSFNKIHYIRIYFCNISFGIEFFFLYRAMPPPVHEQCTAKRFPPNFLLHIRICCRPAKLRNCLHCYNNTSNTDWNYMCDFHMEEKRFDFYNLWLGLSIWINVLIK